MHTSEDYRRHIAGYGSYCYWNLYPSNRYVIRSWAHDRV